MGSCLQRLNSLGRHEKLGNQGIGLFVGINVKTGNMVNEMIELQLNNSDSNDNENKSLISKLSYKCGKTFDLSLIEKQMCNHEMYGIVVIDGKGLTIGNVCGNQRNIIYSQTIDLPKKHGRGGQSAGRFFRQRV